MTSSNDTSPFFSRKRSSLVGALLVASSAVSCASVHGAKQDSSSAKAAQLSEKKGSSCASVSPSEPRLESTAAIVTPKSHFRLLADVSVSSIQRKIAAQIPKVLAAEKDRPVGAPGRATFTVRRGSPSLRIVDDKISVHVPISADISVCKPIGSGCFKYGSCSPKLKASFSLADSLGPDYSLAPPRGTIHATRRCVIGIDVTPQIESLAKKELRKVEAQIRSRWPDIKESVGSSWAQLARPLPLTTDTCFNLTPDAISYVSPHVKERKRKDGRIEKRLHAGFDLRGTLARSKSCDTEKTIPPLVEATKKNSIPKKSQLWIPELLPFSEIQDALDASLSGNLPEEQGRVQLEELRLGKRRIALLLRLSGNLCGRLWVSARFKHQVGQDLLTLSDWKITHEAETPKTPTTEDEKLLIKYLTETAEVPLKSQSWFGEAQEKRLKSELAQALPPSLELQVKKVKANAARVLGSEEGIHLLHPLSAELRVKKF